MPSDDEVAARPRALPGVSVGRFIARLPLSEGGLTWGNSIASWSQLPSIHRYSGWKKGGIALSS